MSLDPECFDSLAGIGLKRAQFAAVHAAAPAGGASMLLRVTEVHREHLVVHDGHSERRARLLPALRARLGFESDAVAVGDWVLAQGNELGECWLVERIPPENQLARRQHDGRDKVERLVIASNVDTALLVMGLELDFSVRRLERYLALVHMAGIAAVVVLTKRDLVDAALAEARLHEARAVLPAGTEAVAVNALGDDPATALAPWLTPGQTLVLLGSSGAGKSTLTNALVGADVQATGGNRKGDGRGRHTTTTRSLHRLRGGACVIDTPGLRTLRLDGDAEQLPGLFGDIASAALQCRFRDCRHGGEPGCAVRDAIAPERLRSFQKLQREAERDTMSALERKAQVQQWKARSRAARARTAGKRG